VSDVGARGIEILLVDDSPTDRLIAMEALSHAHVASRVNSVDNGVEAMAYLRREGKFAAAPRPDLILLDLNLPKKDGREVLREIKQDPSLKWIPVIVLTTSAADDDVAQAYEHHANSFITKPVDFPRFTQALEAVRNYWVEVVTLPPARASSRLPSERPRPSLLPSSREGLGVVLLSDDARLARELRELCEGLSEGVVLTLIDSPGGWHERLAGVRHDVLLVDLASGGSDGIEACRRARAAAPSAAIIAIVPDAGAVAGELVLREGADDYLEKTEIGRASLAHALRSALRQRKLGDQLRSAQRMQAIGQLASGIAHDFNNLLTVLHGHAELLAELTTDARVRDSAQGITDATERAEHLTRQLLAFSQHQTVRFEPVDLNRAVNEFSKTLRRVLGGDVRLGLELAPRAPLARADIGLVEQLLLQLAIDGREAMPAGGELVLETRSVSLDAAALSHPEARAGAFSTFILRDTRPSLPAAGAEPPLSSPASSLQPSSAAELPEMALDIVRQHQGWIQLESAAGTGRSVEIFLPSAQPERAAARPRALPVAERGTETVLLVDDESPVRQMAKAVLGRHGYRVIEARSGPDAITRFEEAAREVDLLLTDIVMPGGMTGRELADELSRREPHLAVVYTSGYGRNAVASDWVLDEQMNFLPKPYSAARLLTLVRRSLDATEVKATGSREGGKTRED
jgi:two-component system, cell cycle sensor histidine kinase and response regulator CckA